MNYNKILALVPEAEQGTYNDETNDGVWLSHAHLAAVDGQLTSLEGQAGVAQADHQAVVGQLETANQTIASNATTISTQTARIAELEAEKARLGAQSSGAGTVLDVNADEPPKQKASGKLSYKDANHPANILADAHLANMANVQSIAELK